MRKNRKESIIEIARDLFARFGFKKTTVDEIARALHMGKSTIYYYFKTKENIFKAVIKRESRFLAQKIKEAINKETSPEKKLRAFILTRMRCLGQLANFYSALKDEYLEHYSFIEKARKKDLEGEIEIIKSLLKEGVKSGVFTVKNPNLTSFAIVTALKGLEYPWTIETEMTDIQRNINILLEVLFNGIRRR
ncbi:TetR/AcrR family transcriptional regulator [candidate division WOR-3 bacterium]|nr:TetR/AcrR family transcriptional regulator [candidate division WOR-3 bacterium]